MSLSENNIDLRDFTLEGLTVVARSLGEKPYRASQIYEWLFSKGVGSIDGMTNLSESLRDELKSRYRLRAPSVAVKKSADDGTVKFSLDLGGEVTVESVIIPEDERITLCVSTQAGCALDCAFCMTGAMGPGRDLTLSEMAAEVIAAREIMGARRITNVVLMGMGEPLLNYDRVIEFIEVLVDHKGFAFPERRVTLSTAGIVPAIGRLGRETNINLAVSLNATTDGVRDRIMPVNRKYPIAELLDALRRFPLGKRRYLTIEYVLIEGVNDSPEDARRLAGLLKGIRCKVNLIPLNPHRGSALRRPEAEVLQAFKDILYGRGYITVTRASKGDDIMAACGQLSGTKVAGRRNASF